MVKDYKGVSFSFSNAKKARRQKRFRLAVLCLIVVLLFFIIKYVLDGRAVSNVQDLLLQGSVQEAGEQLSDIENSMFQGKNKRELRALLHLFKGEYSQGKTLLDGMNGTPSVV